MASTTTNLALIKPAGTDKIRIAQINSNMDAIDTAFGAVGSTPVQTQINNLQDGLAIVANNNTHAAIAAGQFVYVKNHGTLAEGLYTANSAIAQDGTLSSSNLTADSSGGLNALNDQLTTRVYKFGNFDNASVRRYGNVCYGSFVVGTYSNSSAGGVLTMTSGSTTAVFTLPSGYKPAVACEIREANLAKRITVSTTGDITCADSITGLALRFSGCWITSDAMPS